LSDAGLPSVVRFRPAASSPIVGGLLGLVAIAAIGLLDVVTGPRVGLSLLYILPVIAAGWYLGLPAAIALALAAATAWTAAILYGGGDAGAVAVWNGFTRLVLYGFIGVAVALIRHDRERLRELVARAEALARTDALTGLANTRAFRERLSNELPRLARVPAPVCIAYVDLDNFKRVNDRHGHGRGDEVLRQVGHRLQGVVRGGDLAARVGGDEFALILWGVGPDQAATIGFRLLTAIRDLAAGYPGTGFGATIGMACFARPPDSVDAAIERADRVMYEAKSGGKDRVAIERG
jgi:diguanylate cyclase (GGDEF)-like protein